MTNSVSGHCLIGLSGPLLWPGKKIMPAYLPESLADDPTGVYLTDENTANQGGLKN